MLTRHFRLGIRLAIVLALLSGAATVGAQQATGFTLPERILANLELAYVASQVHWGTPKADAWAGGSPGSVKLANAYEAEDLAECMDIMTAGVEGKTTQWLLASPLNSANKAEATSSDKFAQVRGFKVEISGSSGKEVDTAWESVSGGDMVIEHTETTIGADKFAGLDLRDSLEGIEGDLAGCAVTGVPCDAPADTFARIVLLFDGAKEAAFEYKALDAVLLDNQLLILWLNEGQLHITHMVVARVDAAGLEVPPAPQILLAERVPKRMGGKIALCMRASGRGTVPYINSVPSLAMFNFSVRNIPLLGSISVGFTIVPPAAPSGSGDIMIEYNGQQSNRFPFTVR